MTDLEVAREDLDAAIKKYVGELCPGRLTTGWVCVTSSIDPDDDGDITTYTFAKQSGLPFHVALGLLVNAQHDMLNPPPD
jgi:hypothetical protein